MNPITVHLSIPEMQFAHMLARQRNRKKTGVQSHKRDPKLSEEYANYVGVAGEIAFSKTYNIEVDTQINLVGGDVGYDFCYGSIRIDVKTANKIKRPRIFVPVETRFQDMAQVYFMANLVNYRTIHLLGWMGRKEVVKNKITIRGQTFFCGATERLQDPSTLLKMLDRYLDLQARMEEKLCLT